MLLDLLHTAIATLQCEVPIGVSLWVPAPGPPGLDNGAWGAPANLPTPFSVSIPQDSTVVVSQSGQEYVVGLKIYCGAGEAIASVLPRSRRARVTYNGEVFRVMEFRRWDPTSNHAEVWCRRDMGDAPDQV